MAAPSRAAADILTLGADWEPQGSDGASNQTIAEAGGANGDLVQESAFNTIQSGTARYIYTGAETGFIAALTAATAWPGRILQSKYQLTGVSIDYSPCAAGKRPVVSFAFRNGPTAEPTAAYYYLTDLVLPTYVVAVALVPTMLSVTAGDAECQNAQWGLTCQFGEDLDKDGAYLAGLPFRGVETLALTFKGIPTSITSTGWLIESQPGADVANSANTDYPDHSYSFRRKVTRTAVT